MSLFERFKAGLVAAREAFRADGLVTVEEPTGPEPLLEPAAYRRYGMAANDRLTPLDWRHAADVSINRDLSTDLHELRARNENEYTLSAFFRGVVKTFVMHAAGKRGPTLKIKSDNPRFNEVVERRWRQVYKMPDPHGRLTGTASLKVHGKQILKAGSSFAVYSQVDRPGGVSFGWQTLHPRRVETPPKYAGNPNVLMGVHFYAEGRRKGQRRGYWLRVRDGIAGAERGNVRHRFLPADLVRHLFIDEEGEQVSGEPQMVSACGPSADLREYDKAVMKASQSQARQSVFVESNSPEHVLEADPVGTSCMPYEDGQVNVMPIGWTTRFPNASQPMAEYANFRRERLAELGRAVHMPLMLVLLSAQDANFSSAQFDGTIYADGIADFQCDVFEDQFLTPAVEQVAIEVVLSGEAERPDDYEAMFSWPKPPHADYLKIVNALSKALEDGGISLVHYCKVLGLDYDQVLAEREQVAKDLEDRKLPPVPANLGSAARIEGAPGDYRQVASPSGGSPTIAATEGVTADA